MRKCNASQTPKWLMIAFVAIIISLTVFFIVMAIRVHVGRTHTDTFEDINMGVNIPKLIWTFWDDVVLPDFVKGCIKSWEKHNPEYKINVLNKTNLGDYIRNGQTLLSLPRIDSHARLADFVRLHVLAEHGGIWMDATIMCTTPLDWLFDGEFRDCIAFYMPNFTTQPQWPVIESWFIAAPLNSPFIRSWRDEFMRSNNFESMDAYLADMRNRRNIDLQNLAMPEYLAIHSAAQAVMQTGQYNIKALDGTQGPFKYLSDNDWNSQRALDALCTTPKQYATPLIKFRGAERKVLESQHELAQCILKLA